MPSLLLRKYKTSEKVELQFESIADISIQELKENASSKLQIPLNDLSRLFDLWVLASLWDFNICTELVYGGRILKAGKTAMDYKVVSGCTIYVMAVKPKKRELYWTNQLHDSFSLSVGTKEHQSHVELGGGLMRNRRVLALVILRLVAIIIWIG